METRSRKRVEATAHRPSPASKRARHSGSGASSSSATAAAGAAVSSNPPPPRARPSTRTSTSAAVAASVSSSAIPTAQSGESGMDMVPSSSSRRDQETSGRGENERACKQPMEEDEEEDRRAIEVKEIEKGKEKEAEKEKEKERIRGDRDRTDVAAAACSTDDDENDGEGEGGSSLHQNLASASSALHGLLRKLGAGLDDLLPPSSVAPSSHQSSRLKRILSGLRAEGEEGRQLEALSQLCELLSIGTEDSLSSFSVDSFVPLLVGLLNHEYSPDMMLLAARALTHLCDVLPSSCAAVVHYGAVPCFCARLLTIEYIDLAEQGNAASRSLISLLVNGIRQLRHISLQALVKISHEHPTACLRAGALMAVLSYLDFFSTGVQRVAVSTAANICRQLPSDAADFVTDAVPLLTNLLQYQDSKLVEHASVCLTRIAEAFASSPEKLDMLCSHGLIEQAARLITVSNLTGASVPQASLSNSTYTGLIRLLSTCASGSAAAAESLLLLRISKILKDVLAGSGLISSTSVSPSSVNRPQDQSYEIVNLVNELLPPMPDTQGVHLASSSHGASSLRGSGRKHPGITIASKVEGGQGMVAEASPREILLRHQPELLVQFGSDLFPVLVQVHGSSVNPPVRHKCLAAINKLIHFSTADILRSLLNESNISSFLAGVLASKDTSMLIMALQISEMLMQKLPDIFAKMFVKEGVVHALDTLIASEQLGPGSPPQSSRSADAAPSSAGGMLPPPRPRRGGGSRRKLTGNNDEELGLISSTLPPMGVSPPSAAAAVRPIRSSLRASAIAQAKRVRETYFPGDAGASGEGITASLHRLKSLCARLNGDYAAEVKGKGKGKAKAKVAGTGGLSEEQLVSLMLEVLAELSGGEGVSTFEFIGSGVVGTLLNFFSCGNTGKESIGDTALRQQALKRLKKFSEVALPANTGGSGELTPLTLLVRKLQDALASLEGFPVRFSHAPRASSSSASISNGMSALTQPFKLRLCRSSGEKILRDYSSNVVLIEPLANLITVEDFLWPRVKRHETSTAVAASTSEASAPVAAPTSELRPSTRSRSAAVTVEGGRSSQSSLNANTSKGKGKAVGRSLGSSSSGDEGWGPETRHAAARRRAAASSVSAPKATPEGESEVSDEDDDMDASPVEVEEAATMDEEELSEDEEEEDDDEHEVFGEDPAPACKDRVHDVQLGDGGEGGALPSTSEMVTQPAGGINFLSHSAILTLGPASTGIRAIGARGSLSFAAAAMAGASLSGIRSSSRDRRYLTGAAANVPAKLIFSLEGKPLNRSLTILQAIQRHSATDEEEEERYGVPDHPSGSNRRLWDEVHTINYQRADENGDSVPPMSTKPGAASSSSDVASGPGVGGSWQQASLLDSILRKKLPCDLDRTNNTHDILLLLRVLEGLNRLAPRLRVQCASDAMAQGKVIDLNEIQVTEPLVPKEEFLSSKLTPKLARQMQDALALCSGSLPSWCHQLTRACPFLFPFETRRQYFHSTAFGLSRALQKLQQQQNADGSAAFNDRELRMARLQRQKVRVSRNRILDSATKVMELYSAHKAVLEVEYFGEVGTGLGPTLEFYTLVSHELQKETLDLWRTESNAGIEVDAQSPNGEMMEVTTDETLSTVGSHSREPSNSEAYVNAPYGLFPRPWHPGTEVASNKKYAKVLEHFCLLGRVMAKALQDGRLLDLPLSTAFYKIVLGQELDVYDIQSIEPDLGGTLLELQVLVCRKQLLERNHGNHKDIAALNFRGSKLEDLCLDFTLPGYPDYELKTDGGEIVVGLDNLEEYISLVVDSTVKTGIRPQIESFRAGFNQVFQLSTLQIFSEIELEYLLCGRRELWLPESLPDLLKFDHGYTAMSSPIRNMLDIMSEFTPDEQRAFLRFVTGAPHLPPGGLAALTPKLTIVRKHPMGVSGTPLPGAATGMGTTLADRDLPSVMTCANYLKLPPYSCKEVMKERLLYAIHEGQGSFDLS